MESFFHTPFYKENVYKEVSGKQINDITKNGVFYKCLADDLTHHKFTYKLGMNEDTNKFILDECAEGGLYFTDKSNIHKFLCYGPKIANIIIPNNARCYLEENKMKSDKIIVKSIVYLKDHEFGNNTEFCVNAVKHNGSILQLIEEQTEEMCVEAVKNFFVLQFVKKQTEKICLEAVKHNSLALQYVENQTDDICLEAVKQNGCALRLR